MKERTFYTINLDIKRIIVIAIILIGFMSYFFMLGNAMGKKSAGPKENSLDLGIEEKISEEKLAIKNSSEDSLLPTPSDEKETEVVDLKPSTENKKAIPVPISPVVEVREDMNKIQSDPPVTKPAPVAPTRKVTHSRSSKKSTPIVLEEKNFYTIQLGAFSSQEIADKFKETVVTRNKFPGKLAPYILKQSNFYVVRVGKSTAKEDLEKIVRNLDAATQGSAMIVKNR